MIVIRRAANMLMRCTISEEASPEAASARRLLSIIKQRDPTAFNEAADGLCEEDEDLVASVERLIISLSVVRFHVLTYFANHTFYGLIGSSNSKFIWS